MSQFLNAHLQTLLDMSPHDGRRSMYLGLVNGLVELGASVLEKPGASGLQYALTHFAESVQLGRACDQEAARAKVLVYFDRLDGLAEENQRLKCDLRRFLQDTLRRMDRELGTEADGG